MTGVELLAGRIKASTIVMHSDREPPFHDAGFYAHLLGLGMACHIA
jgi:hypothetical protein